MLGNNVIIPFDGANSEIPAGFVRVTDFDERIPRHSNTGVGATGGSDTHIHTTQPHSHVLNDHVHAVTFADWTASPSILVNRPTEGNSIATHGHGGANTSSMSAASSSSDSPNLGSGSTLPPYYSVIYIKSLGLNAVPAKGILFTQDTLKAFKLCDGNNSTPNLIGKFLRGAAAGGDAGSTGGTSNHTHDASHTHTQGASHTHGGTSGSRTGSNVLRSYREPYNSTAYYNHAHTFTTGATIAPISSYSGNAGGDALVYPPYSTLKPYKNMSGQPQLVEVGAIALTTEATIPVGWVLCDGNNGTPNLAGLFVLSDTTANSTGGASTHTHPNLSHTHLSSGHTHSGNTNGPNNPGGSSPDGGSNANSAAPTNHAHGISTDSITATYQNANIVIDAGSSIPAYIEAKYIMATVAAIGGGGALQLHLT